jgi:hypothetical protein
MIALIVLAGAALFGLIALCKALQEARHGR